MARILLLLLLAFTSNVHAKSLVSEVTPTTPTAAGFAVVVTHKRLADGGATFTIAVSEKEVKFSSKSSTGLALLKVDGGTTTITGGHAVASKKENNAIVCVFEVSKTSLADPNLCFVFTNPVESVVNGETVFMPSADFVCVRLKAFVEAGKGQ